MRQEFGCKFAIDDFGNGFSNFDYLLKLDIDYVKIDGALIRDSINCPRKITFLKHIASFAKALGLRVVAEYIEDRETAEFLREMGVAFGQGYFYSPPISSDVLFKIPQYFLYDNQVSCVP